MTPLILEIQSAVTQHYGLERGSMKWRNLSRRYSHPRQVAMWLSSWQTERNLSEIGRAFARDHSTVIHALKVINRRRVIDPQLSADLCAIRSAIARSVESREKLHRPIALPMVAA